jgi:hypothetical protein
MKDFRDNSADLALTGAKKLKGLLDSGMHDKAELQAVAQACNCFHGIALNLVSAGAPVRMTLLSKVTR